MLPNLNFGQLCAVITKMMQGAGLAVDFIGENIYLYAQVGRPMAEWRKGPDTKTYGKKREGGQVPGY